MLRLIVTRLVAAIPTLFAVVAISFFLMRLAPGGPFDQERALDPAIRANLDHLYGLDKPLLQQFGLYLLSLAHGDFGPSTHWRDFSVNDLFATALPISIRLGSQALALALVIGVALGLAGVRSQARRGGPKRVAARAILAWRCRPLSSPHCCRSTSGSICAGCRWADGAMARRDMRSLPVVTLALPQIAIVAKLTDAAMRDALAAPHIRHVARVRFARLAHRPARAARRHAPGAFLLRAGRGGSADRLDRRRDDLRNPRHRALLRRRRASRAITR